MASHVQSDSRIASVMHAPVVSIRAGASLREAALALHGADVGTLAVMDGDVVAGVISERDVVGALADGADPDRGWVSDVMSPDPRYLTLGDQVGSAVEIMLAAGIRHLPVVDEGQLVGIVSIRDLAGALVA
ncbi:MAG TPA: CBS domain-containing protein [Acidimicrobiales bacterium]|nr:CBS domain-containing protein [Acidimicrobiales bacterium]